MKSLKDYTIKKKEFLKTTILNNDNIYTSFNDNQIKVIQKYYEVYTKYLFNKLIGSLRLEVSKEKADRLVKLKGAGSWEFVGMIDMMKRGAVTCELGHPLRYVYMARNIENNEKLYFGSRCVGDFFDLDSNSLKALVKVKDDMFVELKEVVAILQQHLFSEHIFYDCKEIGILYNTVGIAGLKKINKTNPLIPIIIDFFANNLPLPKSLICEISKFQSDLSKFLEDSSYLGIDLEKVTLLKNSPISLISNMFTFSEIDVLENVKKGNLEALSDFYNFRTITDLNTNSCIWVNRNERLLKAQSYFRKMGIENNWTDIYQTMIKKGLHRDIPNFYYGVEILLLFDKDIGIESNYYVPKEYSYKGTSLSKNVMENFDFLIDYMATKEFFMCLKEVEDIVKLNKDKKAKEFKEIEDMMEYLKSNLENDKYIKVKGIQGVKDIVNIKNIPFEDMTEKQQNYVKSIYNSMRNLDKAGAESKKSIGDKDINNRYTLLERADILAKIQRLQTEVIDELPDFVKNILNSVMTYKYVSDNQIYYINDAFSRYILKESGVNEKQSSGLSKTNIGVKKWNLIERPEIKEKILELQKMSEYSDIPHSIQDIFNNILKYKSVSENQMNVVEKTYRRYFKGR